MGNENQIRVLLVDDNVRVRQKRVGAFEVLLNKEDATKDLYPAIQRAMATVD
jgi:hypothetical protein